MARRSPRHPDGQRNAAYPDSDHEDQRATTKSARTCSSFSASASPDTQSRTTSATTCYAGTKMKSRRASDTPNISLQSRMRIRDQRRSRRGDRYSPDGLVGDDGLIECKSRRQKYQIETILADEVPAEYLLQCQTGLLVTGRKWLDFISYCGGLPMFVKRVWPCPEIHRAILDAALAFEQRLAAAQTRYDEWRNRQPVVIHTERTIEQEIMI